MLKRFSCEVGISDAFVTYDPERRLYHIDIVKSDAKQQNIPRIYCATGDDYEVPGYVRAVDWVSAVSRDVLSKAAQNALNPQLTCFRISDQASEEIRWLCG